MPMRTLPEESISWVMPEGPLLTSPVRGSAHGGGSFHSVQAVGPSPVANSAHGGGFGWGPSSLPPHDLSRADRHHHVQSGIEHAQIRRASFDDRPALRVADYLCRYRRSRRNY